jgi:hypothetical protein
VTTKGRPTAPHRLVAAVARWFLDRHIVADVWTADRDVRVTGCPVVDNLLKTDPWYAAPPLDDLKDLAHCHGYLARVTARGQPVFEPVAHPDIGD